MGIAVERQRLGHRPRLRDRRLDSALHAAACGNRLSTEIPCCDVQGLDRTCDSLPDPVPADPHGSHRAADAEAIDPCAWVDRHGDALFRFALARLGDRSAAEDVVQEALLGALQGSQAFDGASSERTWLTGIVRHKVLDHLRRSSRETRRLAAAGGHAASCAGSSSSAPDSRPAASKALGTVAAQQSPAPSAAAEQDECRAVLRRCLDQLPVAQRQLILLREVDDVSTETLCEIFSVSPTNLWTLVHRAKSRLRALFEAACAEPRSTGDDATVAHAARAKTHGTLVNRKLA